MVAAGCSMRSSLGFMTLMSEVPRTNAIIVPPPGGPAVIAVLERKHQNGVSQEIALSTASATAGQNAFHVSLINEPETQSEIDDTLKIRRVTQELVQTEMEDRLAGVEMRTSLLYAQNKYGPFGFATGRASTGDLCLYAWQQIEPNQPAILMTSGAISVRLRMCDADATEEQLLRSMYSYTISAYFPLGAWNPYGSPPPPPAALGQIDAPVYPLGMGGNERSSAISHRRLTPVPRPVSPRGPLLRYRSIRTPSTPCQPHQPFRQPLSAGIRSCPRLHLGERSSAVCRNTRKHFAPGLFTIAEIISSKISRK
jgi:Cellulose biosynthesis protein BcsN